VLLRDRMEMMEIILLEACCHPAMVYRTGIR
jgi:hypothetical protein